MQICDRLATIANEFAVPKLELKYKKSRVGLSVKGSFFNAVALYPNKSGFVKLRMRPSECDVWVQRLKDVGLEPQIIKDGRLEVRIDSQQLRDHEPVLRELIHQVVKEHQA